jgi:cell division septation protein DedD
MADIHIRRTRRSKHYMAPVLLDHSGQKKLMLGMTLALLVVFLGGYVTGFRKAEMRLASFIDTVALDLPGIISEFSGDMEPQRPMLAEPGESIDVDIAGQEPLPESVEVADAGQVAKIEVSKPVSMPVVKAPALVATEEKLTDTAEASRPLAIGGPLESDPGQGAEPLIQDTATEETAVYSIQVGMYGLLDNAERKVEELIAADLSAYITDYLNRKKEVRYNVRFGYFADRRSAKAALATYEKVFSGSGYVLRMPAAPSETVADNSSIETKN